MSTPVQRPSTSTAADAEIDALLAPREEASIVDSLFAVAGAHACGEARDALSRVLSARLQARLARRMREAIEQPGAPRSAA